MKNYLMMIPVLLSLSFGLSSGQVAAGSVYGGGNLEGFFNDLKAIDVVPPSTGRPVAVSQNFIFGAFVAKKAAPDRVQNIFEVPSASKKSVTFQIQFKDERNISRTLLVCPVDFCGQ